MGHSEPQAFGELDPAQHDGGTGDSRESYINQNRYLVDHAQYLVTVSEGRTELEGGSFHMTAYAQEKGLEIMYIHPDTAEVSDTPK